jgi:hypothetical protein
LRRALSPYRTRGEQIEPAGAAAAKQAAYRRVALLASLRANAALRDIAILLRKAPICPDCGRYIKCS